MWVLLASLLATFVFVASAAAGTFGPAATPAKRLFVANMGDIVSVYPIGKFSNVPTLITDPGLAQPAAIALDEAGNIYIANWANGSVTAYAAGANGIPNPVARISGSRTGLAGPMGIAVDARGNIYVANEGRYRAHRGRSGRSADGSVTVYRPHSHGNVRPIAVIAGSDTELNMPVGLALDSTGNIYVTNLGHYAAESITVYRAGSSGDIAPIRKLAGNDTGINTPAGIAVDGAGKIYLTNDNYHPGAIHRPAFFGGSVEIFSPGSTGNVAPVATIAGCAGFNHLQGVAVDSAGNIYVADSPLGPHTSDSASSIAMYPAGSDKCATPSAMICGAATGLNQPTGLTLDSKRNIYVTDYATNTVAVLLR